MMAQTSAGNDLIPDRQMKIEVLLTVFVDEITPFYRDVSREEEEVRFLLLQAGDRLMPEIDAKLADHGARVLSGRRAAEIRTHAAVRAIEPGRVRSSDQRIEAETIVLTAGIVPNPVVACPPVEKDQRGHIVVDGTMRCKSHPEVWALGDCALIPVPDGNPSVCIMCYFTERVVPPTERGEDDRYEIHLRRFEEIAAPGDRHFRRPLRAPSRAPGTPSR